MPINYKYDEIKNILFGSIEGRVTIEDLRRALVGITESGDYPADVRALWDLRKLDFTLIDSKFGEQLVALRKRNTKRGNARIAIIAETDLSFGMSRMYEMLSDGLPQQIMVFRDYSRGEAWLLDKR